VTSWSSATVNRHLCELFAVQRPCALPRGPGPAGHPVTVGPPTGERGQCHGSGWSAHGSDCILDRRSSGSAPEGLPSSDKKAALGNCSKRQRSRWAVEFPPVQALDLGICTWWRICHVRRCNRFDHPSCLPGHLPGDRACGDLPCPLKDVPKVACALDSWLRC
jgi:hypothetical protein